MQGLDSVRRRIVPVPLSIACDDVYRHFTTAGSSVSIIHRQLKTRILSYAKIYVAKSDASSSFH